VLLFGNGSTYGKFKTFTFGVPMDDPRLLTHFEHLSLNLYWGGGSIGAKFGV